MKSGSPATKPDRKPGRPERLDSDWNETTLARLPVSAKAVSSAPGGGVVAIDLRVAFVGEEEKVEAPRERDGAGKIGAARRPRLAGSTACRDRRRPRARSSASSIGSRSGRKPSSARARQEDRARRPMPPPPRHRPDRTDWGSAPPAAPPAASAPCAGKIAENNPSREPLSGSTCALGIDPPVEHRIAASQPIGDRLAQRRECL